MTSGSTGVAGHYGRGDLVDAVLAALKAAGKDVDHLTPDDLAAFDEFHTRGRAATLDLARLLKLKAGEKVLDLGCGIGGPARYLAATFDCRVTGLDLTEEFCRVATALTARMGLSGKVDCRQGDALDIPYADASFDAVWSQNLVMNIADRAGLYAGIRRVLKAPGRYGFADVVAGPAGAPHFPVPWARTPSLSFLLSAQATRQALETAGLRVIAFEDQTADAIARARAATQERGDAPPALGRHLLMGEDWPVMARHSLRNMEEGRTAVIQGMAVRVD